MPFVQKIQPVDQVAPITIVAMATPEELTAYWSTRIQSCATQGQHLRVRGGGTKDFYGEPSKDEGEAGTEVLDTRPLQGILSYEPSELVVTALAGTPLAELEAALAREGQALAFEPPHFGSGATVGGAVASGLAGPARASVGGVRDFVLGVRLINGRGELLTFGGQVMKNVAGYDVSRLMAGSLGTLGVLVDVSLKVLPVAVCEATLMCAGVAQQAALDLLNRWGGQPLPLNASCWVRDDSASPVQDYLFIRLRGAVAAVEAAIPRLQADVQAVGGRVSLMDKAQAGADWQACRDQALPFFTPPSPELCLWRLSLPQTAPALDLPWPALVEWHGALRWLWAPTSAGAQLRALAQQLSGHATLQRASLAAGDADKLLAGVFTPLAPVQERIQRALQQQFDPAGVFATGRGGR
jgi:glycolate oxidase FAD binding subunit